MNDDTKHPGIPTQAIHEAYLDVQRARKQYRLAEDGGGVHTVDSAHGQVQESVLAFYELLRPHLRENDTVRKYWDGQPPQYPGGNQPPDHREGYGVVHVQTRSQTIEASEISAGAEDIKNASSLQDWHDILELPDDVRLKGIVQGPGNGALMVQYFAYQLGLKHLDDWRTQQQSMQNDVGGMLKGKQQTQTQRVRVDMVRLRRAARELADAARDMNFLSQVGTPINDDPTPI